MSGYVRMAGKEPYVISRRCTRDAIETRVAQIPTAAGMRSVALISEDTISNWIIDDNPTLVI